MTIEEKIQMILDGKLPPIEKEDEQEDEDSFIEKKKKEEKIQIILSGKLPPLFM